MSNDARRWHPARTALFGTIPGPAPAAATDRSLNTTAGEIIALLVLLGFYAIVPDYLGGEWLDTANFWGPIVLTIILVVSAWRMLQLNPASLWSALFWFRIATALYFGFGQMAPLLMNGVSRLYFANYFDPTPDQLLKLNMIVTGGAVCLLLGSELTARLMRTAPLQPRRPQAVQSRVEAMWRLGLYLLAVGGIVKYMIVFPQAMGWTQDVLPGAVVMFGSLTLAGIYLLTLSSLAKGRKVAFLLVTLIVLIEMASGLVLMIKGEVLLPALVYLMALLTSRASALRIGLSAAALVLLFSVLVPLVSHGRDKLGQMAVNRGQVGIVERVELLSSYFDLSSTYAVPDEYQGGYLRLSYASMGGFFVNRYDTGQPGHSLEHLFIVLVPRILWPEKPIINLGQQMSILVSGNANNAVGAGLFFESYWNLGWMGLPVLLIPYGAALQLLSRYSNYVIRESKFVFMPVLFMAMRVGIAIDNHYVGQIGSFVQIVGLYVVIFAAVWSASFFTRHRTTGLSPHHFSHHHLKEATRSGKRLT